jgi:hypothetical protein
MVSGFLVEVEICAFKRGDHRHGHVLNLVALIENSPKNGS